MTTNKMSTPSRLLGTKRSTPLPSQFLPYNSSLSCNNFIKQKRSSDFSDIKRRPWTAHPNINIHQTSSAELTGDSVKDYLRYRQSFLEDFLLHEVPVAVLQKVLKRKTHRRESGYEVASTMDSALAKLKLHPKPQSMIGSISCNIQKGLPFRSVLFNLCKFTAEAAYADCFKLFLRQANYLLLVEEDETQVSQLMDFPIRLGDTIPGYVAATKLVINVNLLKQRGDFKFPKGSTFSQLDCSVIFVLCVPILKKNGEVIGVLELGRRVKDLSFSEEDRDIVSSYLSWATVIMDCTDLHYENAQSHLLFDAFGKITRTVIGDDQEWSFESVFESIRCTVTTLMNCEAAKIFMASRTGRDLYLQLPSSNQYELMLSSESNEALFSEDSNQQNILSQSDIVYPGLSIIKRVADYVVTTGEVLNLNDKSRKKFIDHDLDSILSASSCKTLLCAPMVINQKILGVVIAVNKRRNGEFSSKDKDLFTSFCEFCSLITSFCKTQREIVKEKNKSKVMNEVLEFHRGCPDELLKNNPISSLDTYPIKSFHFNSAPLCANTKAKLAAFMFLELVDTAEFDENKILRFCLAVSKNYRPIPYHNWEHAFSVTHCLYYIIIGAPHLFTYIERMALFVACLCHDLDHRGKNNFFLSKSGSPLANLYSDPIIENHHFSQTVALLQIESLSIFSHFSDEEYFQILTIIHKAIMASDITQFFRNKEAMSKLCDTFSWENSAHREIAQRMLITVCDLNSTFKPWDIYRSQVDSLFVEFYEQGDSQKLLGYQPIDETMDRDFCHKIPEIQMNFIANISVTSCQLLEPIMPHLKTLREGALLNIEKWKALVSSRESVCKENEKNQGEQT